MNTITVSPENESRLIDWLKTRKGIAVWSSKDLGSPSLGSQTFTPATNEEGNPPNPPHWNCGQTPDFIVTDPAQVVVLTYRQVSRVKVRRGPPCFGFVNRRDRSKLDTALTSAGKDAGWQADYSNMQPRSAWFEAVITIPDVTRALSV